MHDLPAIYKHFFDIVTCVAEDYFDEKGNSRFYPNPPKLSDLEVVALACCAEALEIDSENLLFSKLASYPTLLNHRGSRQRYNARRRNLISLIDLCLRCASEFIDEAGDHLVTDSMPLATAHIKRERRSRACRRSEFDSQLADKTYHASSGSYLLGYKLHLIATVSGVYVDHVIRPASQHDARVFGELAEAASNGVLPDDLAARLNARHLLADRGYDSKQLRLGFSEQFEGVLKAHYRSNNSRWEPMDPYHRKARKYVETLFSQACDEVRMKINRAKRYSGLAARVSTKILTRTLKQWVNYHTGKPLNQTKHWLA